LSNVTRLPPTSTMTVEQALAYAVSEQDTIDDVLIVGYTKDRELFIRSSKITREWSLWLLMELIDHVRQVGRHTK
jgi:hypothetical protein